MFVDVVNKLNAGKTARDGRSRRKQVAIQDPCDTIDRRRAVLELQYRVRSKALRNRGRRLQETKRLFTADLVNETIVCKPAHSGG
jgi:hypothetical protein